MITIRNEQVQALAAARFEDFAARLTAHLREYFPQELGGQSAEEIRPFIQGCVGRSAAFGLSSERAIASFAHLPLLLGAEFEDDPRWEPLINRLGDRTTPPDRRAELALSLAYDLRDVGAMANADEPSGPTGTIYL